MSGHPSALDTARKVIAVLRGAGHEAYLAGGSVRDHLLGIEPKDLDIATAATPDEVERLFRRTVAVGKAFGVIRVLLGGHAFEVATFRAEAAYLDARHPSAVRFADAREDVLRRDFTINGLLLDPDSGEVIDHVGGRADLDARRVRAIGDPDQRLAEDALRLVRAVRFGTLRDFHLDPATEAAVARHAGRLELVAAERIRDELLKIATHPSSRRGDAALILARTGLLRRILGLEIGSDRAPAHARVLDRLERRELSLFLAALLRDARPPGAPPAAWRAVALAVAERLRCSLGERAQLSELLADRARYRGLPRRPLSRQRLAAARAGRDLHEDLLRAEGDAGAVLELLAALRARHGDALPPPLLGGHDLLQAGFLPGPAIGWALKRARLLQLRGAVATRGEALAALGRRRR